MERPSPDACPTLGSIPAIGLGTYRNEDPEQCATSVETALEVGYRHIDTAEAYGNEEAVGRGIARADVDRDEVFLASKVWHTNLDRDGVRTAARRSANRLGVDSIDCYYVHWPGDTYDPMETLPALAELVDEGLIEGLAVSNFEPEQLERAVDVLDEDAILANQIEAHPLLPQEHLRETCERFDITVVAYAPIARGEVFDNQVIEAVAADYDATPAQVSLAWVRQRGMAAIPKATGRGHIEENWASLGLELDEEDLERIDAIEEEHRVVDPAFGPWN